MINEVISDLINIEVARVEKMPQDKQMLIYLYDTQELFSTNIYKGYVRMTKGSRFDLANGQPMTRNNYKLVLFLDKTKCLQEIMNIIANLELKNQVGTIMSLKVGDYYLDSWDNILKEMNKDKFYTKYKVIVVDLESEEIICKEKIKCN